MESAVPTHLQCPRTRTRRIEDDYAPPYPAWVGRADPNVRQVVMGYFGVQFLGSERLVDAKAALAGIVDGFRREDGPARHDLAHYVDSRGYDNVIAVAYWLSKEAFERWRAQPEIGDWWDSPQRLEDGLGYFREILSPVAEGFETLFSADDRREGVGEAMGGRSADAIQEHGYWGSMRDRLPIAQTDALKAVGELSILCSPGLGRRAHVRGHENIAFIRSGQDWSATTGRERELYLKDMEPVFREGMDFLCTNGQDVGCYVNRYMQRLDAAGRPMEKSFGLSYWKSLSAMERWSEAHHTHVAIFGTFMRIVQELNFQVQLRLYHEVSVLKPDQQEYEYINCHPRTGLLNGLPG